MTDDFLAALCESRDLLYRNVCAAGPEDYRRQFHSDLSPLGWHLGHCVYTEVYWLREVVLQESVVAPEIKALYIPELSPKGTRGATLPPLPELCSWALETLAANLRTLQSLPSSRHSHALLEDDFLIRFLAEHWSQHYETTMYVLAQQRLQREPERLQVQPLAVRSLCTETVTLPAGLHEIGADGQLAPYDNERPAFAAPLETVHIARRPVSNGEFLGFIEAGGYEDPNWWDAEGRLWQAGGNAMQPVHWRRNGRGWYGVDHTGSHDLDPGQPVHGLSRHEAAAFARWAGARLPHEYEWEAAHRAGCLEDIGLVWEWCENAFHPYEGFRAWPYAGYSSPYFDGRHYSLRGGSCYTRPVIRRPTFRNYYQADKRHVQAGLRLVFD